MPGCVGRELVFFLYIYGMMRLIKILAITFLFCGSMALAEEPAVASQTSTAETELKQELAVRDSVMHIPV